MCTASWHSRPGGGYEFWFSRDEQRRRSIAEPPRVRECAGISWLAPKDPDGGGTWIAVNQAGLTLALLNAYDVETPSPPTGPLTSRGLLIPELAAAQDSDAVGKTLETLVRSGNRAPFHLIACATPGAVRIWTWDGSALGSPRNPREDMLTTSSYNSPAVVAARRQGFAKRRSALDFHEAPGESASPFCVRMSREDARTVSLTKVEVSPGRIMMGYAARQGDAGFRPMQEISIPTRNPASSS